MAKRITREEWSREFCFCFVCGRSSFRGYGFERDGSRWWLETHEIARGPHRQKALNDPAAWLRVCSDCHREKMPGMPIAEQLALKKMHDRKRYNRRRVNKLRGRAQEAVTEQEVDEAAASFSGCGTSKDNPAIPLAYKGVEVL